MAKKKKPTTVEQALIEGLQSVAAAEKRNELESKGRIEHAKKERQAQIKEFLKNIKGFKIWKD